MNHAKNSQGTLEEGVRVFILLNVKIFLKATKIKIIQYCCNPRLTDQ